MKKHMGRKKDQSAQKRRQYVKPELTEYGHVAKLTQTGGNTHHDGFGTKKIGA